MRGAWIEIRAEWEGIIYQRVAPPCGERGLKLLIGVKQGSVTKSLPLAGSVD